MQTKTIRIANSERKYFRQKPNLPRVLFWDFAYDKISWRENARTMISRVLIEGTDEQWQEIIRFYGFDPIRTRLITSISYLPNYLVPKICKHFNLEKDDLRCSRRQWWRGNGQWNNDDF